MMNKEMILDMINNATDEQKIVFFNILLERERQKRRWNDYHITDFQKLITLVIEELGEACQAHFVLASDDAQLNQHFKEFLRTELTEATALLFSFLENLEKEK